MRGYPRDPRANAPNPVVHKDPIYWDLAGSTGSLGVESIDRLSRSEHIFDAAELLNTLWKKGITLVLLGMGGIEINREIFRNQPGLEHMLIAEFRRSGSESGRKSELVREAKAARRRLGRETGAPITGKSCPAWLVLKGADKEAGNPGHYVLHPEI